MTSDDKYLIQDDSLKTPESFKLDYKKEDEEKISRDLYRIGYKLDTDTKIATKFMEY